MCDTITIAICTCNHASLLRATLEQLQHQQVPSEVTWRVLVVDNNSTDETRQVIERMAASPRLPGLRRVLEAKQGLSHARRRAIAEANSDWIAFVDDDCFLYPNWIEEAMGFCRKHPQCGAFGGRVELLWERPPTEDALRHQDAYARQDYGDLPLLNPVTIVLHLVGAGLVVKREAVDKSRWLDEAVLLDRCGDRLSAGGDTELILRIRRANYEVWYNPEMRLQHFIPAYRMTPKYLCRLHRGLGEADAFLRFMGAETAPSVLRRCQWLASRVAFFLRRVLARIYHDLIRKQPIGSFRLIQVHEAYGQMRSAIRWLWQEPRR